MPTPKVIINFSKQSDKQLDKDATDVREGLIGNPNFPTPYPSHIPSLNDLGMAITQYQEALKNAADKGKLKIAIKNAKRKDLETILNRLGRYVEMQSAGDEAKILSTNFKIRKQPSPVGPLPPPENFTATPGYSGQIKLSVKPIKGAKGYQWEYKLKTATSWDSKPSTAASVLLAKLVSAKEYEFRVVAIGASKVRNYSEIISSFVA